MGKRTALTDVTLTMGTNATGAATHSVEAMKEVVSKIFQMEREGTPNGTYNETCQGVDPYHNSDWEIEVNDAGEFKYSITFQSEVRTNGNGAINRNALSERRIVEISLGGNSTAVSESQLMSLVEQIQKFEDTIARFGASSIPNGNYAVTAKGKTPYGGQPAGQIGVTDNSTGRYTAVIS